MTTLFILPFQNTQQLLNGTRQIPGRTFQHYKVREGEKTDIPNYKFEKNTVNLLPLEYYETYKKTRPSAKDIKEKYCQFYGEDKFFLSSN